MIQLDISKEHMNQLYEDFGRNPRVHNNILIEEMSELTKELCKINRQLESVPSRDVYPLNIAEEMAHVYVCLEAVRELLDIPIHMIQDEVYRKENKE